MKTRHILLIIWAGLLLFCEYKLYQPEELFPWQPGKMIGVLFGFLMILAVWICIKQAKEIEDKYMQQ